MAETMTKKWNRAPLAPERVEEMERYLNKMSHEGWQCCEIVRDELRFVRGEQDEYIYRVQYFYESRDGEKKDYLRTLGLSHDMLHVVARVDDPEAIKQMVSGGVGVAVLSALAVEQEVQNGTLLAFEMDKSALKLVGPQTRILLKERYSLKSGIFNTSAYRLSMGRYMTAKSVVRGGRIYLEAMDSACNFTALPKFRIAFSSASRLQAFSASMSR